MHAIRRRLAVDEGMSIVEVLVAILVLAVVLSAAASALASSLFVMVQNENRTKATALANEELENLRALPWGHLGFYQDDFTDEEWDDNPGRVELGDGEDRPAGSPAPQPTEAVVRGGVTFDVTRDVTWFGTQEMKELRVTVAWSDRAVPRSITVETNRAPNPDEQEVSLFFLSQFDAQPADGEPDPIDISSSGDADRAVEVTALTSAPATWVYVEYQERNGVIKRVYLVNTSGDGLDWSKTWGDGIYANGEVQFTFYGTRNPNPDIVELLGSKLVRFLQPVEFLSVTPASVAMCVEDGEPAPELTFELDIAGLVGSDEVVASWDGEEEDGFLWSTNVSGAVFRVDIPEGSYGSEAGDTEITFSATRLSDDPLDPKTTTVTVTVTHPADDEVCP